MLLAKLFPIIRSPAKLSINTIYNSYGSVLQTTKSLPWACINSKNYSTTLLQNVCSIGPTLLCNQSLIKISNEINSRTLIKFSIQKGKRKSVNTVLKRFYRLHWGGWIRTIAGRHRRVWSKSPQRRIRVQQHVLCNSTQSTLLDKMVTKFWRRPKYYVDNPYEPYHTREECAFTYRKPKPYFPPNKQE